MMYFREEPQYNYRTVFQSGFREGKQWTQASISIIYLSNFSLGYL